MVSKNLRIPAHTIEDAHQFLFECDPLQVNKTQTYLSETVLHLAIRMENYYMVKYLCIYPGTDMSVRDWGPKFGTNDVIGEISLLYTS